MMKQILFNTEMVRATLDGHKTVTRRVVNHKHLRGLENLSAEKIQRACVVPYRPGDILYVRETFRIDYLSNIIGTGRVHYKADGSFADIRFAPNRYDMMRRAQLKPGWRPNENMPREAARIFLRVTDVRVERLHEIDDEGAKAEGANVGAGVDEKMRHTAIQRFADIWDSTIKPADRERYGWAANPWVWVIRFERCEKPEES